MNQEKYNGKLCRHENVTFHGMYSLIGNYVCDNCGKKIDPVEYHKMYGLEHRELDAERN